MNERFFTNIKKPEEKENRAMHIPTRKDEDFIATLKIDGIEVFLQLNVEDSRGYQVIVSVLKNKDRTYSDFYHVLPEKAFNTALSILAGAYKNCGLIAQKEIIGNIQLDNEKGDLLLQGYIIGRGDPSVCYIENVPLRGPKAYAKFNMCGDGNDEGNQSKTKWENNEMEAVAYTLEVEIVKMIPEFENVSVVSSRNLVRFENRFDIQF